MMRIKLYNWKSEGISKIPWYVDKL